jgi:NADPH:quinone reductase
MKAIVLDAFGDVSHFKLADVPVPQPKKGEVRIKLKASGFNPVDFKIRMGWYGGTPPLILGGDCSGVIDALGPDTQGFSVGDEVYAMPFGPCSNGSYAEFLCIPVSMVAKKPSNLSFEQAAAVPIAAMTAYRAMISSHAIKRGDTLFIAGAGGGVGSFGVQLAKHHLVKDIFTVAGSEESAKHMHSELGLKKEHILIYKGLSLQQLEEKLIAMNGGKRFDATMDFVGGDMKRLCLNLTRHSGHCSSVLPEHHDFNLQAWEGGVSPCFNKSLSVHFVLVVAEAISGPPSSWAIYSHHLAHLSQLIESGAIHVPTVKTVGSLSVETVREAHRLLEEGRVKGKLAMRI